MAALHSELVQASLFPDFHALWPERFTNKTNGITPRRWLLRANPELAAFITARIGERLDQRPGDAPRAGALGRGPGVPQDEFLRVKLACKERLARLLGASTVVHVDPPWLFDIHAKRIHEYKRQLLNALHLLDLYLAHREDGEEPAARRVHVFAGKAAPGYARAKLIIKLDHERRRPRERATRTCSRWLRVAFVPDYRVTLAETIIPAADLSEQISTAGTEASGTGNMKFALNGALTIGTLDGANIEIADAVGAEQLFVFGLRVEEVRRELAEGRYRPRSIYEHDARMRRVVDTISSGLLAPDLPGLFDSIREQLLTDNERYVHLADLVPYAEAQQRASELWRAPRAWARKALLTVARMGRFSSDRTVAEYADEIWGVRPCRVATGRFPARGHAAEAMAAATGGAAMRDGAARRQGCGGLRNQAVVGRARVIVGAPRRRRAPRRGCSGLSASSTDPPPLGTTRRSAARRESACRPRCAKIGLVCDGAEQRRRQPMRSSPAVLEA